MCDECYDQYDDLTFAQQSVHEFYASETFDCCSYSDRRREYSVSEHGASAYHCRYYKPCPAAFDQTVEREDAALAVVVSFHSYEHMLYCSQKSNSPDYQRKRSYDKIPVNISQTAIALDNRLHNVHRGCTDISVHDSYRDKKHPHAVLLHFCFFCPF